MVLLIIIPIKWLFHWEYTLFSDKPTWGQYDDLAVGCVETTCHRLKKRPLDQAISRLWNCSPCKFPCFGKDWNHLPSLPRVDRRGNQWYQWFRSSPFGTHPFLLEISNVFRFVSWLLVIDSRKFLGGIISIFVALTSPFLLVESSFLCWHLLFWQVKFGQTLIFTDSRRMIKWWNKYICIYIYMYIYTHTYVSYWSNYQALFKTRYVADDSSGISPESLLNSSQAQAAWKKAPGPGPGRNGTAMVLCFYS